MGNQVYLYLIVERSYFCEYGGLRSTELRCNRHLLSRGDHKYKVRKRLKQCGTVLSEKIVQTGDGNIKAEQWFIKINNWCYSIRFVDSVIKNIGKRERCL